MMLPLVALLFTLLLLVTAATSTIRLRCLRASVCPQAPPPRPADDQVILRSQLRTEVGNKSRSDDGLICHCFGVGRADAQKDPSIKDYVVEQTKQKLCSCDTSNPSGRYCLKDVSTKRTQVSDLA